LLRLVKQFADLRARGEDLHPTLPVEIALERFNLVPGVDHDFVYFVVFRGRQVNKASHSVYGAFAGIPDPSMTKGDCRTRSANHHAKNQA
jgi:hypothetical protein